MRILSVQRLSSFYGYSAQLLRMSSIYMIYTVRASAIDWLMSRCPTTLEDYQFLSRSIRAPNQIKPPEVVYYWRIIEIGQKRSLPLLLPTAYYACMLMDAKYLKKGAQFRPGQVMKLSSTTSQQILAFGEKFTVDKRKALRILFTSCKNWRCPNKHIKQLEDLLEENVSVPHGRPAFRSANAMGSTSS